MKKLLYILVLFFTIGFVNANETEDFRDKAKELKTNHDFKKAIKFYIKAIKNCNDTDELIGMYFEVSDCYFQLDDKKLAIRVVEEAIVKFGVTKMDIISFNFINNSTNYFFIDNIKDYNNLRQKYISNLDDIDDFLRNSDNLVKK